MASFCLRNTREMLRPLLLLCLLLGAACSVNNAKSKTHSLPQMDEDLKQLELSSKPPHYQQLDRDLELIPHTAKQQKQAPQKSDEADLEGGEDDEDSTPRTEEGISNGGNDFADESRSVDNPVKFGMSKYDHDVMSAIAQLRYCTHDVESWHTDFKERVSSIIVAIVQVPAQMKALNDAGFKLHRSFLWLMKIWMLLGARLAPFMNTFTTSPGLWNYGTSAIQLNSMLDTWYMFERQKRGGPARDLDLFFTDLNQMMLDNPDPKKVDVPSNSLIKKAFTHKRRMAKALAWTDPYTEGYKSWIKAAEGVRKQVAKTAQTWSTPILPTFDDEESSSSSSAASSSSASFLQLEEAISHLSGQPPAQHANDAEMQTVLDDLSKAQNFFPNMQMLLQEGARAFATPQVPVHKAELPMQVVNMVQSSGGVAAAAEQQALMEKQRQQQVGLNIQAVAGTVAQEQPQQLVAAQHQAEIRPQMQIPPPQQPFAVGSQPLPHIPTSKPVFSTANVLNKANATNSIEKTFARLADMHGWPGVQRAISLVQADASSATSSATLEKVQSQMSSISNFRELMACAGDGISDLSGRQAYTQNDMMCIKAQIKELQKANYTIHPQIFAEVAKLKVAEQAVRDQLLILEISGAWNVFRQVHKAATFYLASRVGSLMRTGILAKGYWGMEPGFIPKFPDELFKTAAVP